MISIETPAPRRNMRYNDVVLWLTANGNRKCYNARQIEEALDGEQNKEKPK